MCLPVRDTNQTSPDPFRYYHRYFVYKWEKFAEPDKINQEIFWISINYSYLIWYNIQTHWRTGTRHNSINVFIIVNFLNR